MQTVVTQSVIYLKNNWYLFRVKSQNYFGPSLQGSITPALPRFKIKFGKILFTERPWQRHTRSAREYEPDQRKSHPDRPAGLPAW